MGHQSKTGFCVGVRTRDQWHLIRQSHHQSPDRMCMCDPPSSLHQEEKSVIGLEREPNHSKSYNDNLCLFRCLDLHRRCDLYRLELAVKKLYEAYDQDDVPMEEFAGIKLDYLYRVETTFQTNVCVYKLVKPDAEDGKSTAELVRRSLCKYPETIYLDLHETHFSFIQDIRMYCHSYRCRKCGDSLWEEASMLRRHERTCTGECVESILAACTIRLHQCSNVLMTRTFEWLNHCATIRIELPLISNVDSTPNNFRDKVHWVARHVPLSVSVASNVPGHEYVQCLITDGDTNKLVSAMMDILRAMSDAAYDNIKDSYEDVLEQLAEALTNWDEREQATRAANDKKSRRTTNPCKKLMGQLYGWMRRLPVIGFNSD